MRRSLLSIVSFLILLPLACSSRPSRVVIGVALSPANHPAVELAAREINATGGIGGIPLELMGLDWKIGAVFNAKEILEWANRFSDTDDLVAVIGHSDSSSTLSAAAIYNARGVPQISTIATNPAITNIGDWTYRLCISDAAQGPALADYSVRDWGKKNIAVFYVNDAYGSGLAELFEARVRELGGRITASVLHRNFLQPDDQEMISSSLAGLKAEAKTELIVLFQRVDAALWTIGAIRESGLKTDILGGDSLSPVSLLQSDPKLLNGMRVSQFFMPHLDDARASRFVKDFREFAGTDPDYGNAFAYDAVYLVRQALLNGGFSRDGVKSHLERLIREGQAVDGIGGAYTLGADHDARRSLHIVEAHDGKQRLLKTLPVP
jgi:branched-chain amino acid transport system substrate-binding protein